MTRPQGERRDGTRSEAMQTKRERCGARFQKNMKVLSMQEPLPGSAHGGAALLNPPTPTGSRRAGPLATYRL